MEQLRLERIKTMLEDKLGEIKSEYEKRYGTRIDGQVLVRTER